MINVTARRRPPTPLLYLVATVFVVALLGLVFAFGGALPALALALALTVTLLVPRARTRRRGTLLAEAYAPRRHSRLTFADGSVRQALGTSVDHPDGRLVLTADGYLLIGSDGRVLHRF